MLDTSTTPKADVLAHPISPARTIRRWPPLLHMVESPPWGGDTMWINCYKVYNSLSEAMKQFLEGLTCLHEDTRTGGRARRRASRRAGCIPAPGARACTSTSSSAGASPNSRGPSRRILLSFLFRWEEQVKFSCRWRWNVGDVVLWDERVTLHSVVDDTSERRVLRRSTVLGDDPCPPNDAKILPRHRTPKTASSGFYGIGGYEF